MTQRHDPSEVEIIGLAQDIRSLLDCAPRLREATLVNRQLMTAGVDRLTQPHHCEIGQFFGDGLEPFANVIEFSSQQTLPGTARFVGPDRSARL